MQFSTEVVVAPLLTKKRGGKAGRVSRQPASKAASTCFSIPAQVYEDGDKKRFCWRHVINWEEHSILPVSNPSTLPPLPLSTSTTLRSCLKASTPK